MAALCRISGLDFVRVFLAQDASAAVYQRYEPSTSVVLLSVGRDQRHTEIHTQSRRDPGKRPQSLQALTSIIFLRNFFTYDTHLLLRRPPVRW